MEFLIQKGNIVNTVSSVNTLQKRLTFQKNSIVVISGEFNITTVAHTLKFNVVWIPHSEWEEVKNLPDTTIFRVQFPNDESVKLCGGKDSWVGKIVEVIEGDS